MNISLHSVLIFLRLARQMQWDIHFIIEQIRLVTEGVRDDRIHDSVMRHIVSCLKK